MLDSIDIIPGKGIGDIVFGITQEEVKNILGEPEKVERHYSKNRNNFDSIRWHYPNKGLKLSFEEKYEFKLSSIATSSNDVMISGINIAGKTRDEIIKEFAHNQFGYFDISNISDYSDEMQKVSFTKKNLNLCFNKNRLKEVQFRPIFSINSNLNLNLSPN